MRVAFVAFCLASCSSAAAPCPATELEVRPFEGAPVDGTHTTCSPLQMQALCEGGGYPPPTTVVLPARCGSDRFGIRGVIIMFHAVVFSIGESDSGAPSVWVDEEYQCDYEDCDLEIGQAMSGWIMPEGPLLEHHGRFHVEFPAYTIEGDYDGRHP